MTRFGPPASGRRAGDPPAAPPPVRPVEQVRPAENFPVALRVLPTRLRRHLVALYGYARYVDDLGDEPRAEVGDRLAALDAVEAGLRDLYAGHPPRHPVLAALAPTVAECRLPADPLLRLIEANRVDQRVTRYRTFGELTDYCALSANPVGRLVLHVFDRAAPAELALSDRVCTGLQLVEHLQDVGQDRRRGRIYLPTEDLERFGVDEDDLSTARASARVRELLRFEADRARSWLDAGAPLVSALAGWSRLAVGGYLAGGRAALDALARADHDPLRTRVRPRRRQVARRWLAATLRSAG